MGGVVWRATRVALSVGLVVAATVVPRAQAAAVVPDPAAVVNPLLGTTNSGNTFPGADAPFGMVQWSPDTTSRPDGGGYSYNDTSITGFSLTHLSGPGCPAMGDVPVLPTIGAVNGAATVGFSHANESASAGAYSVTLANGVKTELTATTRSGLARFTFPATAQANLLFKLASGDTPTTNPQFTVVSPTEVSGSVTSGHFCGRVPTYTTYFDMVFDRPMTGNGGFAGGNWLTFDTTAGQVVQTKVGLSFVSVANATANRLAENPGWDFAGVRQATHDAWNRLLGRIQVSGGTTDRVVMFYTALYHSLLHPNVVSDSNGQYLGFDNRVHSLSSGQAAQYGNFSGWDIYRTQAQLMALVAPAQASDTAQSLVNDYAQGGLLPKWSLVNGETLAMVGDPGPVLLADYYAFGARGFDTAAAKAAVVAQGTRPSFARPGLDYLANIGYLPVDVSYGCCNFNGAVATQLEYATADFAISAFVGALGDPDTGRQFANRAQYWKNILNTTTGLMQPRLASGAWRSGFDPASEQDFVEGTSWQYTGMVPFNLRALADMKGGNAGLQNHLDSLLADLTGSGGNHADLANEPSIVLPWEYDYVGQPWKTQAAIRRAQQQKWSVLPTGWGVSNDDLGAMSAWYVWSVLGMYPVTPGTADLALGSPLFSQITIALGGGGTIAISAPAAADNAPYVQSLTFNGSAWNNAYLPPSFALDGGTLTYTLGTTANTSWATAPSSAPPSYDGDGGAPPPAPAPGPTGALASGMVGMCLDVDHSGTANGTKVVIANCNGTDAQRWTLPGDGSLQAFGKCLEATGSGMANGTPLQLWECNGTGGQRWMSDPASGSLVNPQSGRCVDDPSSSTTNGTQLQLWDCYGNAAQRWTPPRVLVGAVTSAIPGKCLDVDHSGTVNGTKIVIATCNGTSAQVWSVPGDGSMRAMGRCLEATGGATVAGTKAQLYTCNGSAGQQWTHEASTGALVNPRSGLCLDDPSSSTIDGTQLQIWDCYGNAAQHWTLPA